MPRQANRNLFQKAVLQGLHHLDDFLDWMPILKKASDRSAVWPEDSAVLHLGPSSFGLVAIAAVEQYASQKKLNGGTAEKFRQRALVLFHQSSVDEAFRNGEALTLQKLAEQNHAILPWIADAQAVLREKYNELWRVSALHTHHILVDIDAQQSRKGKRGNAGRQSGKLHASPDALMLDVFDAEVLMKASNCVDLLERGDPVAIRNNIRPVVKDVAARGLLSRDESRVSQAEAIDVHVRRITRKFDEDEKRWERQGYIGLPASKSKK